MGVWIETSQFFNTQYQQEVTPFVGVWIETKMPLAEHILLIVTPFVGVWIETYHDSIYEGRLVRHTLRGCVD